MPRLFSTMSSPLVFLSRATPLAASRSAMTTRSPTAHHLQQFIEQHFDLRPSAIIEALGLRRPIFRQTAAYGHFGRPELDLPWERTDRAEALASDAGVQMPEAEPAAV